MSKEENYLKEQSNDSMSTKDFLIGALVGGIVGAATALLLAPKSGRELREDFNEQKYLIKEKTEQFKDTAITKGSEFVAAAKEKTDTLSQMVTEQSANLMEKVKSNEKDEADDGVPSEEGEEIVYSEDEIEQKLAETKQTFAETEANLVK